MSNPQLPLSIESVPTPVTAAVGLVATSASLARRLPAKALLFGMTRVSTALELPSTLRQEYDALAQRGETVLRSLLDPEAAADPLPQDAEWPAEDDLADGGFGDETSWIDPLPADSSGLPPVTDMEPPLTDMDPVTDMEPVVPEATVTDTGVGQVPPEALPLKGFDQLTLGALRGRLRRLTPGELAQLRAHEAVTGRRPQVLAMLDNRIAKLEAEGLSGSDGDLIADGSAPPE